MKTEKTHWLQSPNKNYLGHWDLPENGKMILTIESAQWEEVKDPITNKVDSKRVIRWKEKGVKPFICNQTNAQSISRSTGIKFMEDSKGAKIELYVSSIKDKKTKEEVDCIRIKNEAPRLTKPELTPDHEKWASALESLKAKTTTIESIKKHYQITEENERELSKSIS